MPSFDLAGLTNEQRFTAVWTASLLHAIARDEAAGRRTKRLTEPKLDTWSRFRGRLTSVDLVSLLFEDAAVIHRVPFDAAATGAQISALEHEGILRLASDPVPRIHGSAQSMRNPKTLQEKVSLAVIVR
jgi:hypothetical protein